MCPQFLGSRFEHLLAQLQLLLAGGREGGFFVVICKQKSREVIEDTTIEEKERGRL